MLKFLDSKIAESLRKIFIEIFPVLFFIFFGVIFLRGVLFSPGVIIGSDWSLPFTNQQIQAYFSNGFTTWTNQNNLLGGRQPFSIALWFQGLVKILSLVGLGGQLILKLWLLGLFVLGGCSMYSLARFLKCDKWISLFGGLVFITTPVFFNYSIMGWTYVLFSLAILPIIILFFIRSVLENKIRYSLISGFLYAIAIIQSQSIIWYPLVLLMLSFFLINNKKTFWVYSRSLAIVFIVGLGLHAMWLIPLFVSPASSVLGSDLVTNEMSRGTWVRLNYLNLLRSWGSVVNYQYEVSYPKFLEFFSFLEPIIIILSLLFLRNKKIVISLVFIYLIPPLLFTIGPGLIAEIPFSNLIRDVARFSILSSLAYVVLFILLLQFLFQSRKKYLIVLSFILCFSAIINTLPFFLGYIVGDPKFGSDIRLRTYNFPKGNFQVENLANDLKLDGKILYLPLGEVMEIKNNLEFNGIFRGARNLFSIYSFHPGSITFYQSGLGSPQRISKELNNILAEMRFMELGGVLNLINIKYLILNLDIDDPLNDNSEIFIKSLEGEHYINKYKSFDNIYIFQNRVFLPHFYAPEIIFVTPKDLEILPEIVLQENSDIRLAIYFNNTRDNIMANFSFNTVDTAFSPMFYNELQKEVISKVPVLEFKKINPTKYRVVVHGATEDFPLVFSESFHEGWKSYLADYKKKDIDFNETDYKILDGNDEDQADANELKEFINQGYISTLGDFEEKNIKHIKWENNKEVLDYNEPYKIDFVSKNFQDTIQNDNLTSGRFYETWFKKPINNNENHLMVNGYANSWFINPEEICADNIKCVKNPDGSYDFELVIEFWPQRFFILGSFVSGAVLLSCLGCFGWGLLKRVKNN